MFSPGILMGNRYRITADLLEGVWSLGTSNFDNRVIAFKPFISSFSVELTPSCWCKSLIAKWSAIWFQSRFTCRIKWEGQDWTSFKARARSGYRPEDLQSISTRICRTTILESPQIIHRCCCKSFSNLNSSNIPSYAALFTVDVSRYLEADSTMVHAGSLHIIALQDLLLAYRGLTHRNALHNSSSSVVSTVGVGMSIVCLACFLDAIADRIDTLSRNILVASPPASGLHFFLHFTISKVY